MRDSQYVHFTADEFAVDPAFRKWCLRAEGEDKVFWNTFLLRYPGKTEVIEQARQMILGVDQYFDRQKASPLKIEHKYYQTLQAAQRQQSVIKMRQHHRQWQIAAVVALFIATAAAIGYGAYEFSVESTRLEYRTGYGEQHTIQLPDGSTVQLNADSKLSLNKSWDDDSQREVWLEGEAYFSVEKKPATQAKFVVHAQELNVEVLGTQFNVNTKEEATQVVLDEGKIKLSKTDETGAETETVTMLPGEMASVSSQTRRITKQQVNTQLYSTWKEGYLTYEEAKLSEVLDDVHRTFGYTIVVEDSLLLDETISGALSAKDLDALLLVLEDVIPKISFIQKNQQLIISKKE